MSQMTTVTTIYGRIRATSIERDYFSIHHDVDPGGTNRNEQ